MTVKAALHVLAATVTLPPMLLACHVVTQAQAGSVPMNGTGDFLGC